MFGERRISAKAVVWAFAALFLVFGAFIGLNGGISVSLAQADQQQIACANVSNLPDLGMQYSVISAITFNSPGDGWVIGSKSNSDADPSFATGTLFSLHWDGKSWTSVPMENPGNMSRSISAIWASASDDLWAVGYYNDGTDGPNTRTLIMHLDGVHSEWFQVKIPGLGNLGSLSGISGTSWHDIWASGSYYNPTLKAQQSIILHYDGREWTPSQLPGLGDSPNELTSISARSVVDAWAIGYYFQPYSITGSLFLHWGGSTWNEVAGPPSFAGPNSTPISQFSSVAATAPNSAWAAGFGLDNQGGPMVAHWDGSQWSLFHTVQINNIKGGGLQRITALSDNDVWIVGSIFRQGVLTTKGELLLLHWDGSLWKDFSVDSPVPNPSVSGAAMVANGTLWIAGASHTDIQTSQQTPYILKVNNSPCPTPTPEPTTLPPTPLVPPIALPGHTSLLFPATGKIVSGIFLDYWNTHGGLAQQGYPISDLMGEQSELDGKFYTVQYFERAVFEYHPENAAPNNVLLSQLGTFEYKDKYPYGAPNERANTDPGTVFFPETSKHLGGAFHYYWVNHGGLAQQGYPISEEFTEISPVDGKPYTVQYFERAVFEYHPENRGTPYEVELSLLGRFRYEGKYMNPPSSATPTPTPQLIADSVFGNVGSNDHSLFWIANDPPTYSVRGYDLQAHKAFLVTSRPGIKASIVADNNTVAWIEGDVATRAGIKGYDIGSQSQITLVADAGPGGLKPDRLALAGDMLYYTVARGNSYGIMARDWKSGTETLEVAGGRAPALSGSELMYAEFDDGPQCKLTPCLVEDLYLHRLSQGSEAPGYLLSGVSAQDHFREYNISGDNVVWVNPGTDTPRVVHYGNIQSGLAASLPGTSANYPIVNNNLVVWSDHLRTGAGNNWQLSAYDTANDEIDNLFQLQTGDYVATQALVGSDMLAYTVGGSESAPGGYLYLLKITCKVCTE